VRRRFRHERADQLGRVLAVGIHRQRVRVARRARLLERVQDGRALAGVLREDVDAQPGILAGHRPQAAVGAVATAVDDDPHRRPLRARRAHRRVDERPGVVARDDDDVRRRHRWRSQLPSSSAK
jgi:hypothetical protein